MKLLAGALAGFVLAVLCAVAVTIAFATSAKAVAVGSMTFFGVWILGLVIALHAPTAGKAWRRLFLCSSIASFLLPLSGVIYTGAFIGTNVDPADKYAGAATAGAAIGGTFVSGILGFIGFFLGVVFLVIGLLIARDKQVLYVQMPASAETARAEPRL